MPIPVLQFDSITLLTAGNFNYESFIQDNVCLSKNELLIHGKKCSLQDES